MCEVEFWEVFLEKVQAFLEWFARQFHLLAAD
jgi:hypothetical protein